MEELFIVIDFNSLWPNNTIWWHRSGSIIDIGSANGLVPDGTKPLPEPMLTDPHWSIVAYTWVQFHRKCSRCLSLIWVWRSQSTATSSRGQWFIKLAPDWLFLWVTLLTAVHTMGWQGNSGHLRWWSHICISTHGGQTPQKGISHYKWWFHLVYILVHTL